MHVSNAGSKAHATRCCSREWLRTRETSVTANRPERIAELLLPLEELPFNELEKEAPPPLLLLASVAALGGSSTRMMRDANSCAQNPKKKE